MLYSEANRLLSVLRGMGYVVSVNSLKSSHLVGSFYLITMSAKKQGEGIRVKSSACATSKKVAVKVASYELLERLVFRCTVKLLGNRARSSIIAYPLQGISGYNRANATSVSVKEFLGYQNSPEECSSSGNAIHSNKIKAILNASCELIERAVCLDSWNKGEPPKFVKYRLISRLLSLPIKSLVRYLSSLRYDAEFYVYSVVKLDNGLAFYTTGCVIKNRGMQYPYAVFGHSSSIASLRESLEASFMEAYKSWCSVASSIGTKSPLILGKPGYEAYYFLYPTNWVGKISEFYNPLNLFKRFLFLKKESDIKLAPIIEDSDNTLFMYRAITKAMPRLRHLNSKLDHVRKEVNPF